MNGLMKRGMRKGSRGFTLVEALVALLVLSFGMLAIAGFQLALTRGADVAKQRAEAVRLAQAKLEELRSFGSLSTTTGMVDYTEDLVSSTSPETFTDSTTYETNTTFRRSWTVTRSDGTTAAASTDVQKWIAVTVEWADRSATSSTDYNQSVTLRSVIARSDPVDMKLWTTNAGSTTNRTPKNRNIDIPYPATDFGDGTSGFMPGGASNVYFVFDNTTGEVTHRCTGTSVVSVSSNSGGCTALTAYLLSGYIFYRDKSSSPSSGDLTLSVSNSNNDLQDVKALAATNGVTIEFTSPTTGASRECYFEQQMSRSSDNAIVAYNASTTHNYAFTTYVCVITPVVVTSGQPARWFGQFLITPNGWSLGTASGTFRLCRFSGDYDDDDEITNAEHPLVYRDVTGTLDNQNYVVIRGNQTCPSDTEAEPLTGKYVNNNTFSHQTELPSGTTAQHGGAFSIQANQWDAAKDESTDTTAVLKM
ncbi:type IV pilus modification PilV family protein [Caldimonas sp. KR1-144]|uniref:type IV pilus modification PilV family protein n=1 Tax=Caldimonas sp. KR1-144 TaxID=3400911 RepID=UPI003C00435C